MLQMERPIPTSFPKQNFTEAAKLTKRLQDDLSTYDLFNVELVGKNIELLVDMIHTALSRKESLAESARPAIWATVTDIGGTRTTKDFIYPWLERVAHNADRIKRGIPVGRYNPDGYIGWSVSEFRDMEFLTKNDQKRIKFHYRVKSGLAYGMDYTREYVINHPSLDVLLFKLGAAGKGSTSTARELIQLRVWTEFRARREKLFMQRWTIDDQLKKYNAKIVRARRKPCPMQYTWACARCPNGYSGKDVNGVDMCKTYHCPLACRLNTNSEKLDELRARTKLPQLQKGQGLQHKGLTGESVKVHPSSGQSQAGTVGG